MEWTECPDCQSEVYDNRETNKQRLAEGKKAMPEWKCKAECGWLKWAPKTDDKAGAAKGRSKVASKPAAVITVGMLAEKMSEAHEALQPFFGALTVDESGAVLDTLYKMAFTELKNRAG